jgi:hypothetical protein
MFFIGVRGMDTRTGMLVRFLKEDLEKACQYLYWQDDFEILVFKVAKSEELDIVIRLAFVVPSIGDFAVKAYVEGLSHRPEKSDEIFCLIEEILRQNDRVTELLFAA